MWILAELTKQTSYGKLFSKFPFFSLVCYLHNFSKNLHIFSRSKTVLEFRNKTEILSFLRTPQAAYKNKTTVVYKKNQTK